ncbi:hypothetical protein Mapa_004417 [Marchantia paleacea]|nr:hypothetical protein Mapa_004417 [Marchantia paleacea]
MSAALIPAGTWKSLVSSGSEACTDWKVRATATKTSRGNEECRNRSIFPNADKLQFVSKLLKILKIVKMVQPLAELEFFSEFS